MTCAHATIRKNSPDGSCFLCGTAPTRGKRTEAPPVPIATSTRSPREVTTPMGGTIHGFTPEELLAAALAEKRRRTAVRCRASFYEFFVESWHVLEQSTELRVGWHLRALCDHAQQMLEWWAQAKSDPDFVMPVQNLCINVPPGTAKSRVFSVALIAWAWTRWPGLTVGCLSKNPTVATRDSVYCRELVESAWYRDTFEPEWSLVADQNAKTFYKNTAGGARLAKGMAAGITGERFDGLIIDDPNDAKDTTEKTLENTLTTYDLAVGNRVNDAQRCFRIIIQQRVHENDLSGHVLRTNDWWHLVLPMEFGGDGCRCHSCSSDAPDPFEFADPRTDPGELLHPERFPPRVLESEKTRLGPFGYAGQMNQSPAPLDGGLFELKWFKRFDIEDAPRFDDTVISVDCTFKKEGTSRVGMLVMARHRQQRYVLDDRTAPMSMLDTVEMIKTLLKAWPNASKVLIEKKANGEAVAEVLQAMRIGAGIVLLEPKGDKYSRASSCQPEVARGEVAVARGLWADDFLHEICVFDRGQFDDRVDAFTQALTYMRGSVGAARSLMLAQL